MGCAAAKLDSMNMFMVCSLRFLGLIRFRAVNLIHNERTKLTATLFNTLATALVAAGLFAPAAAMVYGISDLHVGKTFIATLILICVGIAGTLHWIGRRLLRRLQE